MGPSAAFAHFRHSLPRERLYSPPKPQEAIRRNLERSTERLDLFSLVVVMAKIAALYVEKQGDYVGLYSCSEYSGRAILQ